MFDHVTLRSARFRETAEAFRALLGPASSDEPELIEWGDFGYAPAGGEHHATENAHVGLLTDIEAFWRDGLAAGLRDDGAPGPRPVYGEGYVGSFLRDLDGNSVEACRHPNSVDRGLVDHVWLRVSDLGASRDFYASIAPHTGFALDREQEGYALFRGPAATFSLVAGGPATRHLHLAFPTGEDAGTRTLDPDGNTIEIADR